MHILIDKAALKMIAATATRKWANLIAYVEYPEMDFIVVDSLDGTTWTALDRAQMATLYTNMSGQEAPEYAEAISQLRAYADTWPVYGRSEAALEVEAERIYAAEEAAKDDDDRAAEAKAKAQIAQTSYQKTITGVEAANAALTPEQKAYEGVPIGKKPQASTSPADRPKQGVTKRIWEIADEVLAVTGQVGNVKEFRRTVVARAVAEGANEGTANTQFGKWKAAKGL